MKELETPVHVGDVLLGKYTVERVLGRGGMGMVVAARHRELGELFAIKLLLPRALADAQATELFLREARAAVQLKGEHIVRVHDVGRLESGAPYMVMEHLVGSDLQQIVLDRGPLPVREAVDYVLQVCDALAEAHAQGLVHRDLKPANLFLTRRPNGAPFVKVLDFGISKRIKPDATDLTNTLVLLGSPFYMAPEQMRRARHVDTRSDVWSMGVVLHQLVTGMMPFSAETLTEVVALVLQEEPILPSRQRPGLPEELDTVVALCLQKRPEHRFQAVEDLAAALRVLTSVDGPDRAAPAAVRSPPVALSVRADAPAALAPPPARPSQPTAVAPAPGLGHELAQTLSSSIDRTAPAARTSDWAWSKGRRFPRRASLAGAALAVLAIGIGWLVWSQQQRSAPAASAIAAQAIPVPVVPPARGGAVRAPATRDTAAPDAVDHATAPAPPPSASAPSTPAEPASPPAEPASPRAEPASPRAEPASPRAEPASLSSAPPRRTAPVRRRLRSAPGPTPTAAGAAAATTAAPAVPPRKYEGIY
ncbi:serine/threonine-protein kinase [Sorangium sp. So ce1335]|uniref:serine/threonine-protein kinase n=1 Tax=Sorangium sp. So ce1335 TaxID=3133335 RepID=UPI003F5ED972